MDGPLPFCILCNSRNSGQIFFIWAQIAIVSHWFVRYIDIGTHSSSGIRNFRIGFFCTIGYGKSGKVQIFNSMRRPKKIKSQKCFSYYQVMSNMYDREILLWDLLRKSQLYEQCSFHSYKNFKVAFLSDACKGRKETKGLP